MPELPDVELFRRMLDATAGHKRIQGVHVSDERALNVSPSTLRRHLNGHRLGPTRRHGKWLLAAIDGDDRWLALHFGMTGAIERSGPDESTPRYARFFLDLEDGSTVAYTSRRLLGKVDLVKGPDALATKRELGPDALGISAKEFHARLETKSTTVKAALMDQSAVAGIGNVYADEILFQSRIHPKLRVPDLDAAAWKRLHKHTQDVLERAIRYGAVRGNFPDTWLTPHRNEKDAHCPRCGTKLRRDTVSGRTTLWCPQHS